MTRYLMIVALALLLVSCAPAVAAAQAPQGTPLPIDSGAAAAAAAAQATQAAAYAQMTQAAQRREAAQAATQQANADREYAAQATAAAQQAARESARLRMEQEAQQATLGAQGTADTLSAIGTRQAITVAATAAAIQATGQAAIMFATATQSAAQAGSAAATAEYVRLQVSREAFVSADRTWADHVVLRAAPTVTAQAQQAAQANRNMTARWVTVALSLGILLLFGVGAIIQLAYGSRIGEARARTAEQQAIKARLEAARAAYVHLGNGQVLVVGDHPMVVDVQDLAHLPADVRPEEPAPSATRQIDQAGDQAEPARLETFLIRAARYAPDRWQSDMIPRHDRMNISAETWTRYTDWLERYDAVVKRDRVGTYVEESYTDLAGIFRAVKDGKIPSPPAPPAGAPPSLLQNSTEQHGTAQNSTEQGI